MFGKRYTLHPYAEWGNNSRRLNPQEPTLMAHTMSVPKSPTFKRDFEKAMPRLNKRGRTTLYVSH